MFAESARFRRQLESLPSALEQLQLELPNNPTSVPVPTPKPQRASISPLNGISTCININLPPVRKFSGEDGNPHGITDFFSSIERNTDHEFGAEIHGKDAQMIASFHSFLGSEAKESWGML